MKKLENENSVQFEGGNSGGFSGDASSDGRFYIDECSTDSSQEESCSTMHTRRDAELMNGSCNETKSRKFEGDDDDESGISSSYELDQFWEPPEPECCDDDMEDSVANYDDDECGDDLIWGKPTSLISPGEEGSWSYKFKEEKQKALEEVMNGKLKSLVNDLLKSFGVDSSACDNWVDIVTSLSWEAASFVKPDSAEGKAMDPNRYVKIKCIKTGSPSQSQFIRGLVFKKHAAHKHMPTKFEKARLLLIEGAVGLSSSELSSFHAMKEEKDNVVKSIIEILERYQPNVILVEETVSRDIQESILKKGWTLVFDMKKHRLERVSLCTVSPTLSSEILAGHKLRQCDSFHFQRFVEEHDTSADGGKRPSKTLMFIEGCPTHLGCTILLMGANSDELKKIKCVVRLAVIMAYNLILETSFLLDQKAMFSTIPVSQEVNSIVTDETPSPSAEQEILVAATNSSCSIDVPISNGFNQEVSHNVEAQGDPRSFEPYDPVVLSSLSSLSASLNKVMGDKFPLFSTSGQSMPSCFSDNGANKDDQEQADIRVPYATEVVNQSDTDQKATSSDEEMASEKEQLHTPIMSQGESSVSGKEREDQGHLGNGVTSSTDTDSILVLISSRNASRGTMCAHSHFSRIKFYQNFDIPLGKFLQHNLLSQKLPCTNCDGSPEDHIFYYAHYNKLLAIQVRSLPTDKGLPGESEGKIWMWSRCGRCKFQTGSSKSTKRVLVSTGSRGFSFGKFLELSFSNTSLFNRLSSGCGHSLHRDFLYFFGLGHMVAMFKYSTITTYSVSLPPEKLEFSSSVNGEFLKKELEDVYKKGSTMFLDVEKALKAIEPRFVGTVLNLQGSMRKFSEIEKMLKEERTQFEIDIQNAALDENQDVVIFKLLTLNRIRLELLLESCVWDRRLHSLLSDCTAADPKSVDQKVDTLPSINTINDWEQQEKGSVKGDSNGAKIYPERDDSALEDVADLKSKLVEGSCAENNSRTKTTGGSCDVSDADHHLKSNVESSAEADGFPIKKICVDTHDCRQDEPSALSAFSDGAESTTAAKVNGNEVSVQDVTVNSDLSDHCLFGNESNLQLNLPSSIQLETDKQIIVDADAGAAHDFNHSQSRSLSSMFSNTENDQGWWTPFSEIWHQYLEDLQRGHLPKLGSITNHDVESTTYKFVTNEGAKLHIPLGSDKFIVSDYEDEFSSIIACALALLKDLPIESEDLGGDGRKDRGTDAKAYESSQGVMRIFSVASPHLSSTGSLDLTRFHSSNISEESRTTSLDGGLDLLNSSVSFTVHPEVSMGLGKLTGKYKYSVLCLYASQFRRLRDRWCTSEVDYIASLSRCRSWDAKGGKSKSLFAKTVDDRFIIKEIKRAEFDSFLKFATRYFEYMDQCYEKRNQTCLAKILGIYQVNVRPRGGKETRHDLMVMENLSFNRSTTRQYDLKGALHARFSSAGNGAGDVLLDQNFVNDMNVSPLYVGTRSKRDLQRAVWNDCTFLRSINVMDYSLLVGVDSQRCELVCGIIDYLRQYTWDKQLENWVKSSLVVPKNQLPTIVSPKEYYKRFRKFIDTHFLSVPDHWCSQNSSNPCKPYGITSGIASPQAESDGDSDQPKSNGEGEHEEYPSSDANSTAQEKQNGFTA